MSAFPTRWVQELQGTWKSENGLPRHDVEELASSVQYEHGVMRLMGARLCEGTWKSENGLLAQAPGVSSGLSQ